MHCELRQNLIPIFRHHQRVFPLGGEFFVGSDDCPAVFQEFALPRTFVYHWLYGENHARNHQHATLTGLRVVHHFGFVVEFFADTVSTQVAYNAETVVVGIRFNGIANIV